jgi:HlyD family type I secretion membrane fusion protein
MSDMGGSLDPNNIYQELASSKSDVRKGIWIAGAFFIGLLGWAALTPLDAGAVAQGYVAVSGNRQAVQHRDGGIVLGLNVSEGQLVKEGDLLVSISASELVASERGMAGELVNLYAQRARLQAERDSSALRTPAEFANLIPEDRPLAEEALKGQRLLLGARRDALTGEQSVLGQRIEQHHAQIGAYQHQIDANRKQQVLITDELAGLKELEGRGFVAKNRVRMVERTAAELDGNYGAFTADIARSNEAVGEARMQMVSMRRQVLEGVATQLREVQVRIDEIQPKLFAAREQLKRAMVRAPASGRVVALKAHTIGGVVAPGEMLMEIVPQNKMLVIDAKAAPIDADDLKVGMPTQVRFSALQERNMPLLHGKISKVSADSFEDERTGQRHYNIEVIVPPAELAKIVAVRGNTGIKAGLPADVFVPMRKRTALGYLLDPLTQMLWLSGRQH